MVPQNSHVAKLFPHQVISGDDFHVTKVPKPSVLSIFKSLCINLLTGLRALLLEYLCNMCTFNKVANGRIPDNEKVDR